MYETKLSIAIPTN